MDPDIAGRLSDLQQIATACAFLLIAVGLAVRTMPVGECDKCAHCRQERLNKGAKYARCPMCFRSHPPSERCP